jgi:hypothetical protein
LKFIFATILLFALLFGCSSAKQTDVNSNYYRQFDLFRLSGIDSISNSDKDAQNSEFVKVSYKNGLPNLIVYHFKDREVTLELQDTLKLNKGNIYVYYTGNLLGGKAGTQREYSLHHIDNGYKLYIDLSDTLLVKSYDNIDKNSSDSYHYMIDVYTFNQNQVSKYSLLQGDTNSSTSEDSLYSYWKREVQSTKPTTISSIDFFPPKK